MELDEFEFDEFEFELDELELELDEFELESEVEIVPVVIVVNERPER